MWLAVLTHLHKCGKDVYTSIVGDNVSPDDEENIKAMMVREFDIDFTPAENGMGEKGSDILMLNLQPLTSVCLLPIGWGKGDDISSGVWRYSKEYEEVTTSRVGIIEGSKRICNVGNNLKPQGEVFANGKAIAAIPYMLEALEDVRSHFAGNLSEDRAKNAVEIALHTAKC